jgi:hypothetical protein
MIVHSWYPPIIYNSIEDGKRYVIADGKWTEVSKDTTMKDIQWSKIANTKDKTRVIHNNTWEVEGSKGAKYTVKHNNGVWSCDCPAFGFSKSNSYCKHIQKLQNP